MLGKTYSLITGEEFWKTWEKLDFGTGYEDIIRPKNDVLPIKGTEEDIEFYRALGKQNEDELMRYKGDKELMLYCKTDVNTLKMESLSIDGKEVIYYDFLSRDGFTLLEGSDTLNASIKNESPISRVKYVNNNSILTDTEENHVFKKFINFVDHMLLFYSLDSRGYEGFMNGSESIAEGIVNSGKVKDFENFMRENGIEYNIGISGWNKHHLFLSMSLTHFIILSFLSQCKKDLEKFQGYRYLLQRTIQI